jgi:hypothetical protein
MLSNIIYGTLSLETINQQFSQSYSLLERRITHWAIRRLFLTTETRFQFQLTLWWTKWHWSRFSSEFFDFPLPIIVSQFITSLLLYDISRWPWPWHPSCLSWMAWFLNQQLPDHGIRKLCIRENKIAFSVILSTNTLHNSYSSPSIIMECKLTRMG